MTSRAKLVSSQLHLLIVLSLMISGCATPSGGGAGPNAGEDPCQRSISGDVTTARRHLRDGRGASALRYVVALQECPEALGSMEFLEVAADAFHAEGHLNQAWSIWRRARETAQTQDQPEVLERLESWASHFRTQYVLVESPTGQAPPALSYAGPFVDARTQRQLDALAEQRGTRLSLTQIGYWLLPGRYSIDGEVRQLQAGTVIRADSQ